ncbi:MAG: methyl-accepting chemotaxis protein [Angelakisella sp.]
MKKAIKQSTLTSLLNIGVIVAIVLALISCVGVLLVNGEMRTASDNRFDLVTNANRFLDASAYLTNQVRSYAVTGDQHHYDNYWEEVNTLKNREIGVANMKEIGITEYEQGKIEEMAAISNKLLPVESLTMEYTKSSKREMAIATIFSEEYDEELDKIGIIEEELMDSLNTRTSARILSLKNQATMMWFICAAMMALVVLAQCVSVFVIKRKIIRPIIQVKNEMMEISKGNLASHFHMTPDTSEIGMLVYAITETKKTLQSYIGDISHKLSRMADNDMAIEVELDYIGDFAPIKESLIRIVSALNQTLSHINAAAEQLSDSAGQVSDSAQSLSEGAAEQAASVEELSAAISEISQQVKANAQHAAQASSKANLTGQELSRGNAHMTELMSAIEDINQKSGEIKKIIKTIDDIAFQTNILALNAAVEAARAGVAGKGFAVVADEVRNLAGKSSEAAKNTTALIEDSIKAVEAGSKIAVDTAAAMSGVVAMAQDVVLSIDRISDASSEQANSITQVTIGVEQISSVVQTNSATSEESAAASEELSGQAQTLKSLVGNFRLKDHALIQ